MQIILIIFKFQLKRQKKSNRGNRRSINTKLMFFLYDSSIRKNLKRRKLELARGYIARSMAQLQADTVARRPWIPIQTSRGWILHLRRRSFARSQAKSHESATVIGSAPPVVANPADITSYYRAMYDERKGVATKGGCAKRGRRDRSSRKGASRVPKERRALGDCVRQLFTTIS